MKTQIIPEKLAGGGTRDLSKTAGFKGDGFAVTAPVGTIRRSAQLIVDYHVSFGKLIYGPKALEDSITRNMEQEISGFEANSQLAMEKATAAERTVAVTGVKINDLLNTRAAAQRAFEEITMGKTLTGDAARLAVQLKKLIDAINP